MRAYVHINEAYFPQKLWISNFFKQLDQSEKRKNLKGDIDL